jgi:hypothetical protein
MMPRWLAVLLVLAIIVIVAILFIGLFDVVCVGDQAVTNPFGGPDIKVEGTGCHVHPRLSR